MAFSNLFTKLCSVDKDVKNSCESESSYGTEIKMGKGARARKRKIQGEQAGSYLKKQCYPPSAAGTFNAVQKEVSRATDSHRPKRTGKDASGGFSRGGAHYHNDKTVFRHDQSYRNTNYTNNQKKNKGKKKQMNAYHNKPYKGGRRKNEESKQPIKRYMTEEFKAQHALEVDGRLICIYYLRGKCIKGDECQLEHIQGYNNLIKEVCKFYVQGFCINGDTCPYMHQSFPCKFFHKKGNCKLSDCKFSHDPLNELTEKLLDEVIKRENEFLELNKKLEQESLGQNENAQMSEAVEESVDISVQPVRSFYNFYKSLDTNEEKETMCQNEQSVNITEENPSAPTEDSVQPENIMALESNQTGPVCYSVEAVLGPQLSKPFLYTTPGSHESPLSVPKTTADLSFNHIEAPYSVKKALGSKSDNTARHLCTLPVSQTLATTSKRKYLDNIKLLSDINPQKVFYLGNNNDPKKLQEKPFKQPPSQQLPESYKTKDLKESVPNPMDKKDTCGNLPPVGKTYSTRKSETPKHPVKDKLCISESLIKQSSTVFKDKTTASPKNSDINKSVGNKNQAASVHQNLPETMCGRSQDTQPSHSNRNVAEERQGSVLSGNLTSACTENSKRPFNNLFASLVPDSVQLLMVSDTSTPRAQSLQKTHCAKTSQKVKCTPHQATTESSPKSKLCADLVPFCNNTSKKHQESVSSSASSNSKSKVIKGTVEPDKTPAKLFHSLFAAPLGESSQTNDLVKIRESNCLVDDDAQLSDLHRSDLIDSGASSSENKKTESVSQIVDFTNEHRKDTLCSTTLESSTETSESPSTRHTPRHQTQDLSHKAGPPNSVFRTLFQRLGPYEQLESHQDRIQISVHQESEKCLTVKQQRKRIENPEQNVKTLNKHSTDNADVALPLHHTSLQTPDVHFTANRMPPSPRAPCTMSVPQTRTDILEPQSQVTNAELTVKPHTEKKPGNEIIAGTSLRDLFKPLVHIKQ